MPGSERKLYTVTYTGGYVFSGASRTLPYDLEMACVMIATDFYQNKGKLSGIQAEKLMSWAATYVKKGANAPFAPEVMAIVNTYKRFV